MEMTCYNRSPGVGLRLARTGSIRLLYTRGAAAAQGRGKIVENYARDDRRRLQRRRERECRVEEIILYYYYVVL